MAQININNNIIEFNERITYYDLIKRHNLGGEKMPFLLKSNGVVKEIRRHAKDGENIEFLYYDNEVVKNAYMRTATFMLLKVMRDIFGSDAKAGLKFRIKNAYYFEIDGKDITGRDIEHIKEKFAELSNQALVIKKETFTKKEALDIIAKEEIEDVRLLFTYSYRPKVNLRFIGDYARYINGEVLYDTSFVKYVEFVQYYKGVFLVVSDTDDEKDVVVREIGEKTFRTLNTSTDWAKKLNINTIGKLNREIARNHFDDLVVMTESYQDKQIGDIAEAVKASGKRIVFIAGPSSSGKTSFSHRLMYHLHALDVIPHPIASDNFFKERKDTPKDEKGEYDFESIDAVDIELLNKTIADLLDGKEVQMPIFNFQVGIKEFHGNTLQIEDNEIIILEGIHCLNPKLIPMFDPEDVFKIYISALTEVSIDNANRIATSDLRLIRRIVRDVRTRGVSAKDTMKRWPSVRRGEEIAIFPFQENADIYFNSALIYEFSVLKNKVLAYLFDLSEDEEVGGVARRLIKILNYFLGAGVDAIPRHSIIREFIGQSIMNVG